MQSLQKIRAAGKRFSCIEKNIDTTIEKVTNIDDMIKYGIMATPGLVINDKLKSTGILPKNEQIINWIEEEIGK